MATTEFRVVNNKGVSMAPGRDLSQAAAHRLAHGQQGIGRPDEDLKFLDLALGVEFDEVDAFQ